MSSPQLRNAVRAAGVVETGRVAALLLVAGEQAHEQQDPASLVYAGAYRTLMNDTIGLDQALVGAVVAAIDHQPGALAAVMADLQGADADGLPGALATEMALAAVAAAEQVAAFRSELDDLGGDAA